MKNNGKKVDWRKRNMEKNPWFNCFDRFRLKQECPCQEEIDIQNHMKSIMEEKDSDAISSGVKCEEVGSD